MATMIPATRYPKPNRAGMPTPPRAHAQEPGSYLFMLGAGDSYRLGLDQPAADGIPDQAGGLVDVELFHNAGALRFRGLYPDAQPPRDLLGGPPLCDKLQNLPFPRLDRLRHHVALGQQRIHDRKLY